MRWWIAGVLPIALVLPAMARADGVTAAAMAVTDGWAPGPLMRLGGTVGTDGAAASFTTGRAFEYGTYDWRLNALEAGAGVRFHLLQPLQVYAAAGAIIAPVGGGSGGGRLTGGASADFGGNFFLRPGVAVSIGITGGKEVTALQVPIAASVEIGYRWPWLSLYAHLEGGVEPIAVRVRAVALAGIGVPLGS